MHFIIKTGSTSFLALLSNIFITSVSTSPITFHNQYRLRPWDACMHNVMAENDANRWKSKIIIINSPYQNTTEVILFRTR